MNNKLSNLNQDLIVKSMINKVAAKNLLLSSQRVNSWTDENHEDRKAEVNIGFDIQNFFCSLQKGIF